MPVRHTLCCASPAITTGISRPRRASAAIWAGKGAGDAMKFALHFGNNTFPDFAGAARLAQLAEAAGFDSVLAVDHVVFPDTPPPPPPPRPPPGRSAAAAPSPIP